MSRLTNAIRDQIISNIYVAKHKKKIEKAAKAKHDATVELIEKHLPKEVKAVHEAGLDQWLYSSNWTLYVSPDKETPFVNYDIPKGYMRLCRDKIIDKVGYKKLHKLNERMEQLMSEWNEKKQTLKAVLSSVHTIKKLKETVKGIETYLPDSNKPKAMQLAKVYKIDDLV